MGPYLLKPSHQRPIKVFLSTKLKNESLKKNEEILTLPCHTNNPNVRPTLLKEKSQVRTSSMYSVIYILAGA